jgi:hypothetical protein
MPELTPTSSGPPFAAAALTYPQQWAGQGRSASFGQLEGIHHTFTYPPELAAAELTAGSLQYPLTQTHGMPAPTAAERASPAAAAMLHGHVAPPGFAYAPQPQAWIAQPPPGVSPWYSEPSPLTELDLNEQDAADPFAGTVSPVYPNRQNTG